MVTFNAYTEQINPLHPSLPPNTVFLLIHQGQESNVEVVCECILSLKVSVTFYRWLSD